MTGRAGAMAAAVLALACPARERPRAVAVGRASAGKPSGPPVGQVVLRTDDSWLRSLSFDAGLPPMGGRQGAYTIDGDAFR